MSLLWYKNRSIEILYSAVVVFKQVDPFQYEQVRGHLLYVLDMNAIKPQIMTREFLLYALGISHAMQHQGFALGTLYLGIATIPTHAHRGTTGFNSAGAWSSVNHFHLQGFFFPEIDGESSTIFPVANQPREVMFCADGAVVKKIPTWKTSCYVIAPEGDGSDAAQVAEIAWVLLEITQSREIPHNILIVGDVIFVFPRQQQRENGLGLIFAETGNIDKTSIRSGRLRIAVAELSGLIIAGDQMVYENLTEDMFNAILQNEISLSPVCLDVPADLNSSISLTYGF
ncbi:unnamed protein product [Phytophthora fragariaefolia]|uniref:GDP-D-glucose phosphorylase 1 n=1 Tax=Phytophthora fragariaefolia TaxID=1490495 RepID=A0A9W7CVS7_9STRA|nr:unnamed protein product [Phytophthora fragariaefolia]